MPSWAACELVTAFGFSKRPFMLPRVMEGSVNEREKERETQRGPKPDVKRNVNQRMDPNIPLWDNLVLGLA